MDLGAFLRRGLAVDDLQALFIDAKTANESDITLLPPIVAPKKIICIGLNYVDHAQESLYEPPKYPTLFLRTTTSLNSHRAPVVRPHDSDSLDFEGEMVVVIGRKGRRIPEGEALDYVFGYSIGNDISVRDYQFRTPQWAIGKNFDGTGPWGPYVTTADELPPGASGLKIETRLNGIVVQSDRTDNMMYSVAAIISYISNAMTLEPGDIIFSGTPAGVGLGRKPTLYMKGGDIVEIEIEHLGVLHNSIQDE
ncbi:fumarylacetoacetate hydrolase family protein [Castellaniella sp. GW247-6E4]|uniref:fumarylacetoacetate hydrolase family protein n=1 Tax=Castellaniella sp. GW247-6E4 TaxID=3140380 RepID=UPI0033158FF6